MNTALPWFAIWRGAHITIVETGTRNLRAVGGFRSRSISQVDNPVLRKIGMQQDVEQTRLTAGEHRRYAGYRFRHQRALLDSYGVLTTITLLIAFLLLLPGLKVELGTVGIFSARGAIGHAAQALLGLLAALLFARLTSAQK